MSTEEKYSEIEFVRHERLKNVSLSVINILYCSMHEHSDYEMVYILDGRAKIRHKGKDITLEREHFLITNPYEAHEVSSCGPQPVQLLCLQFSRQFCEDFFPALKMLVFGSPLPDGCLSPKEHQKLVLLFFRFCKAYWSDGFWYPLESMGALCQLLSWLLQHLPYTLMDEKASEQSQERFSRSRRLRGYIDLHYQEKISLEMLAREENLTRTYISHLFREDLNISFQQYLNEVRLQHAIELMPETKFTLTDICMEAGFSNNNYMNQAFEAKFGCSAREFRKTYGEQKPSRARGQAYEQTSEHILPREEAVQALEAHILSLVKNK